MSKEKIVKEAIEETVEKEDIVYYAEGPTYVTLTHPEAQATIFYTTDGTYPVPNKVQRYVKPFPVYETTIVKAVAVVNEDVSPVFTQEYTV